MKKNHSFTCHFSLVATWVISLYCTKLPKKIAIMTNRSTDKISAAGMANNKAPVIIPSVVPPEKLM